MIDPTVSNEIRKIDARPVAASPVAGSLADMMGKAGEPPMANYVYHATTSTTYVTALDLTGSGAVKIFESVASTNKTYIKITIDGNVVYEDMLKSGSGLVVFCGTWAFRSSCKIEQKSSTTNESRLYLSYASA